MTMPFLGSDASSITRQVLEGLVFMHEQKFAHRDLKPKVGMHRDHPRLPILTLRVHRTS